MTQTFFVLFFRLTAGPIKPDWVVPKCSPTIPIKPTRTLWSEHCFKDSKIWTKTIYCSHFVNLVPQDASRFIPECIIKFHLYSNKSTLNLTGPKQVSELSCHFLASKSSKLGLKRDLSYVNTLMSREILRQLPKNCHSSCLLKVLKAFFPLALNDKKDHFG